jgi:hypothetical protein
MNSRLKGLANAIHIHNEYYRVAGPILEHIKQVCKQFIGKKIKTQKGLSSKLYEATKIDKASIEVKPLPSTKWANLHYVSLSCDYNDLSVEISLCFSDGTTGCTYEKRSWYFGKADGEILVSIDDSYKVPTTVLNFEQELAAIKEFRRLEKLAEAAEEKINIGREAYKYISLEDI